MSFDLNLLDIVYIVIMFISILFGILRGFIKELFSIIFLILAVVLSILFYKDIGYFFKKFINNPEVANFAGFVTTFLLILIAGIIITFLFKKLIVIGPLKSIDRLLGALFGFVRAILICSILLFGIIAFPGDRKGIVRKSQFSPYIFKVIKVIMEFVPEKISKNIYI